MKLRIKGNSVRLRLTRREVERIGQGHTVEEVVQFGTGTQNFTYALEPSAAADEVKAEYSSGRITVKVPSGRAAEWAASDLVAMANPEGTPAILIEKDFVCSNARPEEDEADMYPNPGAAA